MRPFVSVMGALGALSASAVLLTSCAETPASGFEAFYAATARGDVAGMRERLSSQSQKALDGAGFDAAQGARSTLRAVREKSRDGARAHLEVEDALGKTAGVDMILEDGRWRVDLAGARPE
jgi:hypothetical protein